MKEFDSRAYCPRCVRPLRVHPRKRHRSCLSCTVRALIMNPRPRFSAQQLDDADELISDGGIVEVEPGEYRTVSKNGAYIYSTTTTSCTCKAGRHGRRCYHIAAARCVA
ncbi:SWIM zinc finger family protein [Actinomadura litoris]|uniref:SWIM zinc finger family protein n=1 Tax=Actinomadura litoris TaxID=2678616 RepID=UPI001FA6A9AD|nr:SWIM zinc finger family protein [Actinomadura litoris]